ncbi:MAG TPA: hypothetical protein VF229_02755 [Burkholderiaceae bacterium]
MKQALLFGHALVGAASALAAGAPEPSMKFLSTPAVERSGVQQREVLQYRGRDTLTVVIKEPAACGVRPAQPSFGLKDGTLLLRYRVEGGSEAPPARACAATAIFVLRNLPQHDLKVVAEAQRAAAATAVASASADAPSMKFLSVPASIAADAHPGVFEYRLRDALTVVVREHADCGQRPSDPSFRVVDGALRLGYSLPETSVMTSGAPCLATAVFTFKNLPEPRLHVFADARRMPTLVAASGSGSGASMKFMAVPATVDGGSGEREVLEHRSNDTLTVVIRDRAECGRRPADPSFDVADGKLLLRYNVPTGDAATQPACRSTAIFTLKHLPEGRLEVVALANPQPALEAVLGAARTRGPKLRVAAGKAKQAG